MLMMITLMSGLICDANDPGFKHHTEEQILVRFWRARKKKIL